MKAMRKQVSAIMVITILLSLLVGSSVHAADMLVTNHGFESGTTGWTQTFGSGGITATTERSYYGSYSLKINDTSSSSLGMESSYISASAGTTYYTTSKVYIESGSVQIYLRFYNSSYSLISSVNATKSTTGVWTDIAVGGTAPTGTAYIRILLYSSTANVGISFWDGVYITPQFATIGTMITATNILGAAFGKNELNEDVVYTVVTGATGYLPQFYCIDVNSLATERQFGLSGATGAWAVTVASDGKAYAGSYSNGRVYRYTPGQTSISDLGQAVSGESYVFDLQPGTDGKVYGGTYANAYVFKYDNGLFSSFGPNGAGNRFDLNRNYVRSLAYDGGRHVLYVGIGSLAKLTRYDCSTGQTDQLLPSAYSGEEFVYNLNFINDKVFPKLSPSFKCPVLSVAADGRSAAIDCEIDRVTSLGVSPALNDEVYYTRDRILYYYDISLKRYGAKLDPSSLQIDVGFNPSEFAILRLSDQTNYPGDSLVAIGTMLGKARLFRYNFQTGNRVANVLNLAETPTNLQSIQRGPGANSKIYTSGYLSGGVGVYTPIRSDQNVQHKGIGQAERIYTLGSRIYYGVYPGAHIYSHDPYQTWNIDTGGNNPNKLFDLKAHEQDRPFGLSGDTSRLFIGTVPSYGKLGGALSIYDTVAGGSPTVIRNIVQDQSVISLTNLGGIVYGGTSIWGGLGATPTQSSAKFFGYRLSDGVKTFEYTPNLGRKAITALTVGPDNKIWGMNEGFLFIYDPSTGTIEYNQQKFSDVDYTGASHVWRDAFLEVGKDGWVYGVIKGRLFKINPSTKDVTTILSSGCSLLTKDSYGYLYYVQGPDLKRYAF